MPAIRGPKSKSKTRRHTRDLDQIVHDLTSPGHLSRHLSTKAAEDLPDLGQHYCVECAKHFESLTNLERHTKGKVHKRRAKLLREGGGIGEREAEEAIGLSVDNGVVSRRKEGEGAAMEVEEVPV